MRSRRFGCHVSPPGIAPPPPPLTATPAQPRPIPLWHLLTLPLAPPFIQWFRMVPQGHRVCAAGGLGATPAHLGTPGAPPPRGEGRLGGTLDTQVYGTDAVPCAPARYHYHRTSQPASTQLRGSYAAPVLCGLAWRRLAQLTPRIPNSVANSSRCIAPGRGCRT